MDQFLLSAIKQRPFNTQLKTFDKRVEQLYNDTTVTKRTFLTKLPKNFNGPKIWKDYLSIPKNQGSCGSCWAFATTGCLADKFNIQTKGSLHVDLSVASVLLCNYSGNKYNPTLKNADIFDIINNKSISQEGCHGNNLVNAWKYLLTVGTTTEKCFPYTLKQPFKPLSEYDTDIDLPLCSDIAGFFGDHCVDYTEEPTSGYISGNVARFFRIIHFYRVINDQEFIKQEIYKWGPVTSGFKIYPDFYLFDPKKEIYKWNGIGKLISGHAVIIVGWGEDEMGTPYWWIKNSWGTEWGINGYFKMARGINDCGIEENIVTGVPDFWYPPNFDPFPKTKIDMWSDSREDIQTRLEINTLFTYLTGGITENGFSKRVLSLAGLSDVPPLVNYKNLDAALRPELFFAGRVTSKKKIQLPNLNTKINLTIFFLVILIIIFTIIFFRIKY